MTDVSQSTNLLLTTSQKKTKMSCASISALQPFKKLKSLFRMLKSTGGTVI